jgi:hypothetical protein
MSKAVKVFPVVAVCFIFAFTLFLQGPSRCDAYEIEIDISPNVLNLQSNGEVVTVHTDIAYGDVYAYSVYLNGVWIQSWKSDLQGNFVAKFSMDTIKALEGLVIGEYNLFSFSGVTSEGESFVGEQEILVLDNEPAGGSSR